MIRESDCVAVRLLNTMGISIQKIYLDLLSAMGEDAPAEKEELQEMCIRDSSEEREI